MTLEYLRKGALGAHLQVFVPEEDNADTSVPEDLSGLDTKTIEIRSPSGVIKTFTAAFVTDGTDGLIEYVTDDEADLDEVGSWKIQAFIGWTGGYNGYVDYGSFAVKKNLEDI
jgi:hypothetical protein